MKKRIPSVCFRYINGNAPKNTMQCRISKEAHVALEAFAKERRMARSLVTSMAVMKYISEQKALSASQK